MYNRSNVCNVTYTDVSESKHAYWAAFESAHPVFGVAFESQHPVYRPLTLHSKLPTIPFS